MNRMKALWKRYFYFKENCVKERLPHGESQISLAKGKT
jgi:hypothetical protein